MTAEKETGRDQATRETQVAKILANTPQASQNTLARAFSGTASPRTAIKAQCLQCVGFDRDSVKNCTGWSCPLWAYRPFQDTQGERPSDKEKAAKGRHPNAAFDITDKRNANTTRAAPGKGSA